MDSTEEFRLLNLIEPLYDTGLPPMATREYKVPRLLWESLEAVLLAQGKRFVRELAKTLEVPEKDLLKQVFPTKDSLQITLHDTQSLSLQCEAFEQTESMIHRCGKPVDLGSTFCSGHRVHRPTVAPTTGTTMEYIKLRDGADRPSLWLRKSDNHVVDAKGSVRGLFCQESATLQLFEIEPKSAVELVQ